jgi:hypothetical protein
MYARAKRLLITADCGVAGVNYPGRPH